ncbi:MAG: RNA methyltransferase [Candidatus Gracilibacteria bacterium]|nr:RNA methyltransferase [Candidatus Gracilibacteria bacterium]
MKLLKNHHYTIVDVSDIEKVSTLSVNDMGIALVQSQETFLPDDIGDELILMLDTINDPGNLGTIIRIADWYGIKHIICNTKTVDFYNPKVIMSTMGSFSRINFVKTDLEKFLAEYSGNIYGALLDGENIHTAQKTKTGCIIIGNESHGISNELLPYITQKITIPRFGGAESLNAGVATAIILDNFKK